MKETEKKEVEVQRRNGVARLSSELSALTKTAFRNTLGGRGFAEAGLITEWASIVGNDVARMSRPVGLAFPRGERKGGVLTVECGGAAALELQHLKPQILDRINSHFGYGAVAELRFRQGSTPVKARSRSGPRDSKPPTAAEIEETTAALAAVPEGEIKASLMRLGLAIRRDNRKK
ncbi:DUF721 domain-containing protein [Dongia sp.]|uniref:DUF721 domain-containing protein n=1 Tax=Dongia sp. TaxID=1977262 RepID=UPI0037517697